MPPIERSWMSAHPAGKRSTYARRVDDQTWAVSLRELTEAADMFGVLSRFLSVAPPLESLARKS
jgi:hypothetical protein